MPSSNKMQIKVTADVTEAARQLGSLTSRVTAFLNPLKRIWKSRWVKTR